MDRDRERQLQQFARDAYADPPAYSFEEDTTIRRTYLGPVWRVVRPKLIRKGRQLQTIPILELFSGLSPAPRVFKDAYVHLV